MDRYTDVTSYSPARASQAVTPNDTTDLSSIPKAIYVGGEGDISGQLVGDSANVTFAAVPAGSILPCQFRLIRATDTTATNIVALY